MNAVAADKAPSTTGSLALNASAGKALKAAAQFWFLVAAAGQLVFVYYLVFFYGRTALQGNFAAWNKVMPHGYTPGDSVGNAAIVAHIFLAIVIILAGLIQLVPQVRSRAPTFHRWTGRVYLSGAVVTSIAGLYLVWVRGSVGDLTQHLGITLDAILIFLCAAMALKYARAHNFILHRQWALRLFLVVSAVWFFRVGLMFWVFANQGPAGFDPKTFTGPFLNFLAFAQTLLPLAVLQLYLRAQTRGGAGSRFAVAGGLFVLTIAMGIGIVIATLGMWEPRL